jgi:hypothetical protein
MIDLWPAELAKVETRGPLTVLKEQASLLGEKTRNIVTAEVAHHHVSVSTGKHADYPFKLAFSLTSAALGAYRYRLFWIAYGIELYPVHFFVDDELAAELVEGTDLVPSEGDGTFLAESEEQFTEILKHIFGARRTLTVIKAMLSQAGV